VNKLQVRTVQEHSHMGHRCGEGDCLSIIGYPFYPVLSQQGIYTLGWMPNNPNTRGNVFRLTNKLAAVARHRNGVRIVRLTVGAKVRVSDEQLSAETALIEVFPRGSPFFRCSPRTSGVNDHLKSSFSGLLSGRVGNSIIRA
jgi:hypothetical protein